MQGVEQALEVIELARDNLNPDLSWMGVVLNIADMRTIHSREAYQSLAEAFGDKVFETTIRAVDRLRRVGRARRSRSSTTAPTSGPTTSRSPASCSRGSTSRKRASGSARSSCAGR